MTPYLVSPPFRHGTSSDRLPDCRERKRDDDNYSLYEPLVQYNIS